MHTQLLSHPDENSQPKVFGVKPIQALHAIRFDGDYDTLDRFLKGRSSDRPQNLSIGTILISTYHGVIAMSEADFRTNFEVVWGKCSEIE